MEYEVKKKELWKKFFLDQAFILIMGVVAFIVFMIISFVIQDQVYLYLAIGVLGIVLLWIGGEAIVWYWKNRKPKEEETCRKN